MVPPTFDSSARRRVNKHATALGYWIMMALVLPFCSCGKAHHGAANLELFRSLSGMVHDAPQCRHVGAWEGSSWCRQSQALPLAVGIYLLFS